MALHQANLRHQKRISIVAKSFENKPLTGRLTTVIATGHGVRRPWPIKYPRNPYFVLALYAVNGRAGAMLA